VPFKTFTASVLSSADMNTYLMKQAVITCTSGTRPAAPVQGMTIYETDTNLVFAYNGTEWVIQSANVGGANRQLANALSYNNVLAYAVVSNPTERTALSISFTKKSTSTNLEVTVLGTAQLSTGVAQAGFLGLRINGVDYDVARTGFLQALSRASFVGNRIIGGVAAGTFTIEPVFKAGNASVFDFTVMDLISYTVREAR
jgi:hypothetical protein